MEFNVNHATPVLFGPDTSRQTGARLKDFGCTRVLFVYDHGVKKAGITEKIIASARESGIAVTVYEGVLPDPPDTTVDEGAALGRANDIDGVVGVGGGSAMDTAKAINALLENPGPISRYFDRTVPMKSGKSLILLPTTAGTGSEVTHFCVLTDTKDHRKKGPAGPHMRARLAIIDPLLTEGMPPSVTADTGMDAFAHAAEAITAIRANPVTDLMAEKAIALAVENLGKAVKDGGHVEARTSMSLAAMLAGYAFNDSNTHIGHAIGHAIGSLYHVPHGNACGVAMPEILEYEAEAVPAAVERIGRAMGLQIRKGMPPSEVGKMVGDALRAFSLSIGQKTLRQLNIPEADLAILAEIAGGPGLAAYSARKATKDDVVKILQKAYDR